MITLLISGIYISHKTSKTNMEMECVLDLCVTPLHPQHQSPPTR